MLYRGDDDIKLHAPTPSSIITEYTDFTATNRGNTPLK
jgi:hypothetical protein